jgi:hypothetical protein
MYKTLDLIPSTTKKERDKEKIWVPVAHALNPSSSGGRDWEDCSLRPAQANSSQEPISKIPNTKKGLVE